MEKIFDVVAIGELLIDFTDSGISNQGNYMFEANPGGAPCNVLAMLSKLGKKTGFIGKVGNDFLGNTLKQALIDVKVDTSSLRLDDEKSTTLAFVHKNKQGDREFSFYRENTADTSLTEDEVKEEYIKKSRLLHFGTLSMSHDSVSKATKKAVQIAKDNNLIISFDPNLRFSLFKDKDKLRKAVTWGLKNTNILKISDDEILWYTECETYDEAIEKILTKYDNIKLLILSKGKEGSTAVYNGVKTDIKPFLLDNTIETTGAGDTFCACVLNGVLDNGLDNLDEEKIKEILTFASSAAALITTKKGALKVMPEREEVLELIKSRS